MSHIGREQSETPGSGRQRIDLRKVKKLGIGCQNNLSLPVGHQRCPELSEQAPLFVAVTHFPLSFEALFMVSQHETGLEEPLLPACAED